MRLLNWMAILGIGVYQETLSRYFRRRGLCCRHHPTCSQYAVLAYHKHGFLQATRMIYERWRDCRPAPTRPFIDVP
jgi:hypothetical protein